VCCRSVAIGRFCGRLSWDSEVISGFGVEFQDGQLL
jgi:hypothetical protein